MSQWYGGYCYLIHGMHLAWLLPGGRRWRGRGNVISIHVVGVTAAISRRSVCTVMRMDNRPWRGIVHWEKVVASMLLSPRLCENILALTFNIKPNADDECWHLQYRDHHDTIPQHLTSDFVNGSFDLGDSRTHESVRAVWSL